MKGKFSLYLAMVGARGIDSWCCNRMLARVVGLELVQNGLMPAIYQVQDHANRKLILEMATPSLGGRLEVYRKTFCLRMVLFLQCGNVSIAVYGTKHCAA